MYDATIGRFFSADPIGLESGDANFYRYVSNNPANVTDPSGLAGVGLPEKDPGARERIYRSKRGETVGIVCPNNGLYIGRLVNGQYRWIPLIDIIEVDFGRGRRAWYNWDGSVRWDAMFLDVGNPDFCFDNINPEPSDNCICASKDEFGLPSGELTPGAIPTSCFPKATQKQMYPIGEAICRLGEGVVAAQPSPCMLGGLSAVAIGSRSQRWWPRISAVADDWAVKGAHALSEGVEVVFRPGCNGTIVVKAFFSSTNSRAGKSAVSIAERALGDIGFRRRLYNACVRGIELLKSGSAAARSRACELRFLMHALEKMGI